MSEGIPWKDFPPSEPIVFTAQGPIPFSEAPALIRQMMKDDGNLRTFSTGATRDTNEGKHEPWGFCSALVEKRYCEYMHSNRLQTNGELRDSDNWKKGIPQDAYKHSMSRHVQDLRLILEGFPEEAREHDIQAVLCAIIFNASGMLHEILKEKKERP